MNMALTITPQRLYDRLELGDAEGVAGHLSGDPAYLSKCVHFLVCSVRMRCF